jgi:hypothetical protein
MNGGMIPTQSASDVCSITMASIWLYSQAFATTLPTYSDLLLFRFDIYYKSSIWPDWVE